MNHWWPQEPKLTRWERWRVRWHRLGWKAFLWWVPVPVLAMEPTTVTFPRFCEVEPELSAKDMVNVQPMDLPE